MLNRISVIIVLTTLVYIGCTSSPTYESQYNTIYETAHFSINYDECVFSLNEINSIAAKKERLFEYVNTTLNLTSDIKINTNLYSYGTEYEYVYNNSDGHMKAYKLRYYVMEDNGHEIAHVMIFSELGRSRNAFMAEGLAVYSELNLTNPNKIEEFINYNALYKQSGDNSTPLSRQILNNYFDYSYFGYCKAGAFLKYLSVNYGFENVKALYIKSITNESDSLGSYIESIFKKNIYVLEKDFFLHCFPDARYE